MENIMIDLETLGTAPGSVILSIGAVEFDETGTGRTFYSRLNPEMQVQKFGMKIDAATVVWWMRQSDEARGEFSSSLGENSPWRAVTEFSQFFRATGAEYVWGNGPSFDCCNLSALFRAVGKEAPWRFYNERCFRTLYFLAPNPQRPAHRVGTAHNALHDARAQAIAAADMLAQLKGKAAL